MDWLMRLLKGMKPQGASPTLGPGLMEMAGTTSPAGVGVAAPAAAGGMSPWLLGLLGAAPVAQSLLNKNEPQQIPSGSAMSVGSKPQIQVPDVYANRPRVRPAFLARLLAGMR